MTDAWRRRVLYVAGAWNIVGAISALLDPAAHFSQLYAAPLDLSDPVQTFFYRGAWVNAIAWGFAYVLAARSAARDPILIAGGAGKTAYCGLCVLTFAAGAGTAGLLLVGLLDLCFAALFAYDVWTRSRKRERRGSLETAIALASQAHAGQTDKRGEAYIAHPLRVMAAVDGADARIAAVLHDIVEKTEWTLARLRAAGFSEAVVAAVDALSKRQGEEYLQYVRRAAANPIARAVKIADVEDNRQADPHDGKYDQALRILRDPRSV